MYIKGVFNSKFMVTFCLKNTGEKLISFPGVFDVQSSFIEQIRHETTSNHPVTSVAICPGRLRSAVQGATSTRVAGSAKSPDEKGMTLRICTQRLHSDKGYHYTLVFSISTHFSGVPTFLAELACAQLLTATGV
jgi:hypothetical protein